VCVLVVGGCEGGEEVWRGAELFGGWGGGVAVLGERGLDFAYGVADATSADLEQIGQHV
jgi:hypothetical protein